TYRAMAARDGRHASTARADPCPVRAPGQRLVAHACRGRAAEPAPPRRACVDRPDDDVASAAGPRAAPAHHPGSGPGRLTRAPADGDRTRRPTGTEGDPEGRGSRR